ncbi:hypothetical protein BCL93_11417 [Onishia taeanensis]|uniref:RiboL-PSP-HEPN domain-containing protein n=1 Tax=Onishia taeanensis TaxID=284577 RepID=A0A328XET4_9GAMM|nr:hypothetical protein [Halomonas taeanensis]RAR57652.1 hypothetical protein BCL93_11417 [Halomonas taeanensis]
MSLSDSVTNFRSGVSEINSITQKAYDTDPSGNDIFSEDQKEFIVSSAFLKMFIFWESFVEDTFAKYLVGEVSTNGTYVNKFVTPNDRGHALKILIGTQKYVDWANHEIVKRLSKLYFEDGEPFSTNISSITTELADLKTIRNAAAHLSSTTQHQLDALASRVLGSQVSNTTVGQFIVQLHPTNTSRTILQNYQDILDVAAENIAANRT